MMGGTTRIGARPTTSLLNNTSDMTSLQLKSRFIEVPFSDWVRELRCGVDSVKVCRSARSLMKAYMDSRKGK